MILQLSTHYTDREHPKTKNKQSSKADFCLKLCSSEYSWLFLRSSWASCYTR